MPAAAPRQAGAVLHWPVESHRIFGEKGGVMAEHHEWVDQFPGAVTVCDERGIILEMNQRATEVFGAEGGRVLIGRNVLDCHPESARAKLHRLMETRRTNVYTIEKRGAKKLIYQAPWYRDGQYAGFVELSLEIPTTIPHFVRDTQPAPADKS